MGERKKKKRFPIDDERRREATDLVHTLNGVLLQQQPHNRTRRQKNVRIAEMPEYAGAVVDEWASNEDLQTSPSKQRLA